MTEASRGEIQPEEALALASAMALRTGELATLEEQVLAGLQGVEYKAPSPEQLQKAHLGRMVLYLAKVESPAAPISWVETLDAAQGDGGYAETAEEWGEGEDADVKAESVRSVLHAWVGELQDSSGVSDEKLTKDFARTLDAAKKVAEEYDTDVATVYATDGLYFETCRRAFTAEETADDISRVADTISEDMFNKVMLQQLKNILPEEILAESNPQELAELAAEMQLNSKFQAGISEFAELYEETVRQSGLYMFIRIYGIDALKDLSTHHQSALMPRKPLVAEVFDKP